MVLPAVGDRVQYTDKSGNVITGIVSRIGSLGTPHAVIITRDDGKGQYGVYGVDNVNLIVLLPK